MAMDSLAANRLASDVIGHPVAGWTADQVINHGKSAVVLHARRGAAEAALKVFDRELVERFGLETQLARIERELQLRGKAHPHLVQILDGGYASDLKVAYVVMEFLPHPSLADVLLTFPAERVAAIIAQVASAARFLEGLGLVHRDIKPDNIGVSSDFQHAVLLDLGVLRPSRADGGLFTDLEQLNFIGTLQYSSPEYLFRRERDDVEGWRALSFYQLGAVLHDLIMRRRIFAEFVDPFARLVEAVRQSAPTIESAAVAPRLVQLSKTCLIKDPELRLKLVSWESFEERPAADSSSDDLELVIKRRIALRAEENALRSGSRSPTDRRELIQAVQTLQGKFADILHHARAKPDVFPPMQVDEDLSEDPSHGFVTVTFPAWPTHLLTSPLRIWFTLKVLDQATLAVRVEAAAALIACEAEHVEDKTKRRHTVTLLEGVFEDAVVSGILRAYMLTLVSQAQTTGDAATPHWLEGTQGGKHDNVVGEP